MPSLFKDLSKKANDLLNKGYDSSNSVKVNTKAANGVAYTATIKSKGDAVVGTLGAKFKHSSGFNVKKLELGNDGTLRGQVDLEGAVDNVTFKLDTVLQPMSLPGKDEKCLVGVDYSHEKVRVDLAVSPIAPTGASLSLLAKVADNVVIGGSYSGELDDTWINKSDNVGIGYTSGDNGVTLTTGNFFTDFTLTTFHQHSSDIAFGAIVGLNRNDPSNANITVGGSYQIDADTSVKGKINVPSGSLNGSTLSLGYNQKLNSNARLTGGSKISLDPQDDLFGAKFAFGLELGSV